MDSLPIELLDIIASESSGAYYALLGYKFFTDTLNYGKRIDFMILFDHTVEIEGDEIQWYKGNLLHRIDGPAWEHSDGTREWYQNGFYHRDNDLPATETIDGRKKWYQNGFYHRDNDLPAVIEADGTKKWYQHGQLHRDNDLHAFEEDDGNKKWYQHGQLHRDNDLPAVIEADGTKKWYAWVTPSER